MLNIGIIKPFSPIHGVFNLFQDENRHGWVKSLTVRHELLSLQFVSFLPDLTA